VTASDAKTVEISIPECESGIGTVIRTPRDAALIQGVKVEPFEMWPDDRGYFLEVSRLGQGLSSEFPFASTQISLSLSYPGTIKAFHYHRHQTDLWVPAVGTLQVALADLRRESPTHGHRNTLYCGALKPWQILIPPGVAHGYKVVGEQHAVLAYVTNRHYNPEDEGRIPFDDPSLAYDWNQQYK
jgi:dTDP-4-dehydrorhamnose 3,5-epimerase